MIDFINFHTVQQQKYFTLLLHTTFKGLHGDRVMGRGGWDLGGGWGEGLLIASEKNSTPEINRIDK